MVLRVVHKDLSQWYVLVYIDSFELQAFNDLAPFWECRLLLFIATVEDLYLRSLFFGQSDRVDI